MMSIKNIYAWRNEINIIHKNSEISHHKKKKNDEKNQYTEFQQNNNNEYETIIITKITKKSIKKMYK